MTHHGNPHTIESALRDLEGGNARFVAGRPTYPRGDVLTRSRLDAHGQTPLAAVLACSDSRAPVELLFDQGFGDVFVIRAAGQVAGVDQIGSLEYAVVHLGVPLILVLGHTKCGAVTAALAKAQEPGALGQLLTHFDPVVKEVEDLPEDQRLNAAIEKAVDHIRQELRAKSSVLAQVEKEGRVKIAGAVYHLESGRVEFRP